MTVFKIKMFGGLCVETSNGTKLTIIGNKQQALLSYLLLNADVPPTREKLTSLLWADRFPDQARQSLRQSLSKLRQVLDVDGSNLIWADHDRVGINTQYLDLDVLNLITLANQGDEESDAVAIEIFQNQLLEGVNVRETIFEDWLLIEMNRLREIIIPVFERMAAKYLQSSRQAQSVAIAHKLIAIDPLRESSHRLLMRVYSQSGQRSAAIKQYNTCADLLDVELGVQPDTETQYLLNNIKSPTPLPEPTEQTEKSPQNEIIEEHSHVIPSNKTSITVLSFQTVGKSDELEAFCDGLTEDCVMALSHFRWLDVIASLPVLSGKVTIPKLRLLAQEHHIRYSVEGSVRQLADRLRVTAQLVDLETGRYVWVHRYDREAHDLFSIQDELCETIAASVESELVAFEGDRARGKSNDAMGAWDCYHLGLATQYEFSTQGNARAQSLFRRAISLDPMFAAAYARLSYALVLSTIYFEADHNSGILKEGLELARKATRLDDHDAVARFALGRAYLALGEYERSIVELKHAIELNPGLAQAHCGLGDSLAYLGRSEEALPNFQEAVRLSPQDPHRWAFSMYGAVASIFNKDFEMAAEWGRDAVSVANSHYWANAALVSALGHLNDKSAAQAALKELLELKPDFSCNYARDRLFYLRDQHQIDTYVEGLEKAGLD